MKTFFLATRVALGTLFVALRLCDVISWHWAWVLAPFWGPEVASWTLRGLVALLEWWAYRKETPEERKARLQRERAEEIMRAVLRGEHRQL